MEDERIRQYVLACRKEAEDATANRRATWDDLWLVYRCQQDNSKKEDWQSKAFSARIFMAVTRSAEMIKKAALQSSELFALRPPRNSDIRAEDLEGPEGNLQDAIEASNMANILGEAAIPAFLLGIGYVKALWENNGLYYESIDPSNMYVDPFWKPFSAKRPRYVIERQEVDLVTLLREAKRLNKDSESNLYDIKVIEELGDSSSDSKETSDEESHTGLLKVSAATKRVTLLLFWGDVVDRDEEVVDRDEESEEKGVLENQLIVLANQRVIIRKQKNPFDHGRAPYIPVMPLPFPGRGVAGNSTAEPAIRMQLSYNNLLNLALDNANFTVNQMYEIDRTAADENSTNMTNVYPGRTWFRKHGATGPIVTPVSTPTKLPETVGLLTLLKEEIEHVMGINEWVSPRQGREKTATETKIKAGATRSFFDVIARDIEANTIKPLLEMAISLLSQFAGTMEFQVPHRIVVGGLSIMLQSDVMVDRIMQLMMLFGKVPALLEMVDVPMLFRKLLSLYQLQDVYKEAPKGSAGGAPGQEGQDVEAKAAEAARKTVANIPPEQIDMLISQLEGEGAPQEVR